jgi:hypothetical protein
VTPAVAWSAHGSDNAPRGEVAERSNAAVLKTVSPQGLGGSNPSLSAKNHALTPFFWGLSGLVEVAPPCGRTAEGVDYRG